MSLLEVYFKMSKTDIIIFLLFYVSIEGMLVGVYHVEAGLLCSCVGLLSFLCVFANITLPLMLI